METVLITGGSGLIGSALSALLTQNNYKVRHLSRQVTRKEAYPTFFWNYKTQQIDPDALIGVDHIIHLAGAGIADKRWTKKRKQEILDSRVKTLDLLFQQVIQQKIQLKSVVCASGINYYGLAQNNTCFIESDPLGKGFLSEVCEQWEQAADQFQTMCPVIILRTGMVLSKTGGALEKLLQPIKLNFGAALGTGKQIIAWIHLDDLCGMYLFLLQKQQSGVFNAVSPNQVTNLVFNQLLAKKLNKSLFLPNIPAFLLKLLLGEMAEMILAGNSISSEKIQKAGFKFEFLNLETALDNLLD